MMSYTRFRLFLSLVACTALTGNVQAQPNPQQQQRISAAIKNAAHNTTIDWSQFVNPFIGIRASFIYTPRVNSHLRDRQLWGCLSGRICSFWHGVLGRCTKSQLQHRVNIQLQAKITIDMTGYAPAGYVVDPTQMVRGLSPLHDSGTGSSLGMYRFTG